VDIVANDSPDGSEFDHWELTSGTPDNIGDHDNCSTTYRMKYPPPVVDDVVITAIYSNNTYTVAVVNGIGGGSYNAGDPVTVVPNVLTNFTYWYSDYAPLNSDPNHVNSTFTFVMPSTDLSISAQHVTVAYSLKVFNGISIPNGDPYGTYMHGSGINISITANPPEPGYEFSTWELGMTGNKLPPILDIDSASTSFTMPAHSVSISAAYQQLPQEPTSIIAELWIPRRLDGINITDDSSRINPTTISGYNSHGQVDVTSRKTFTWLADIGYVYSKVGSGNAGKDYLNRITTSDLTIYIKCGDGVYRNIVCSSAVGYPYSKVGWPNITFSNPDVPSVSAKFAGSAHPNSLYKLFVYSVMVTIDPTAKAHEYEDSLTICPMEPK
jgi:hypothetical protein